MHQLSEIAIANLKLLVTMDQKNRKSIFLVFDCTREELRPEISESIAQIQRDHEVVLYFYTERQCRIARKINWGWVYAWMSWSIGIGASRTKHVILHDLDALPLGSSLFEGFYAKAIEHKTKFHGIQPYTRNGVSKKMGLATTFQLVIDAEYLRNKFKPRDGFNRVGLIESKYIDFDTFLYMQWVSASTSIEPIDESQLVHPTQMICQFTDFISGRNDLSSTQHSLLTLIYMQYLGGEIQSLNNVTKALQNTAVDTVPFRGKSLKVSQLAPEQWAWLEKQIRRLEQALFGKTRPEIDAFLAHFILRAGTARTVGLEPTEQGGVADY